MYETSAGTSACLRMSVYWMPVNSAIRNAAAPITGGVSWPLVEEATSTAPAFSAGRPVRFISGTYAPHVELEQRLAAFHGREAAMIYSSAYAARP